MDNPYEALDLDPGLDLETLTEILREHAEELPPEERRRVQGLWRALTLHSRSRLRHALMARPRSQNAKRAHELVRRLPSPAVPPEDTMQASLADALVLPDYRAVQDDAEWLPETPVDRDPFFALGSREHETLSTRSNIDLTSRTSDSSAKND